ncbi:hypothetical protein [Fimbriiglobus ruber]|uniref:Squalene cyclase C-terminal domain-containing protein n=1 Tax=Fimbriiglobus ruber TaxID=1908690 RepID=A0A225DBW3_9BACT|nr:hypothetical protein [Fimbriiglobus ruber]OWK36018.1 hypothetical protein FRUB_08581 [Fimbriiglobus ruber]
MAAPAPDKKLVDKPADKAAVIRVVQGAEETPNQRLVRKHIPAWVISGAVHVALIVTLILVDRLMPKAAAQPPSNTEIAVVNDDSEKDQKQPDLTNPDIGLDSELPAAVQNDNVQDVNVDTKVVAPDAGIQDATSNVKQDIIPPAGIGDPSMNPGAVGDAGAVMAGAGGGSDGAVMNSGFNGRGNATKSKLLASGGGNSASEAAVARGLVWLAKQQRANGSWVYDGSSGGDTCAATGMGLLPFLAAGQTHKVSKDNKYNKNVEGGLKFLINNQKPDGSFNQSTGMYSHAIATVALCEALG